MKRTIQPAHTWVIDTTEFTTTVESIMQIVEEKNFPPALQVAIFDFAKREVYRRMWMDDEE